MPSLHSISQALSTLAVLARAQVSREGREMLAEMRQVQRSLPARYNALPLPEFLAELTPERADWADRDREQVRELVDARPFGTEAPPSASVCGVHCCDTIFCAEQACRWALSSPCERAGGAKPRDWRATPGTS
jgi:hypothetical protein